MRVVPIRPQNRPVFRLVRTVVQGADAAHHLIGKPQVRPAVAPRVNRTITPLQHPARVGETAFLFDMSGGWQDEHLGGDVFGGDLAVPILRPATPELGGIDHRQVAHHQPVQLAEGSPLQRPVHTRNDRVLPDDEIPPDGAVSHRRDLGHERVIAGDPGQQVEPKIVRRGGVLTKPGFQHRHQIGVVFAPPAGRRSHTFEVVRPVDVGRFGTGQIAGQQVVQNG